MSPMELVSADLYEFNGNDFMVIADAYSGFVEATKLPRTTSAEIIKAFEKLFSFVGYPARLRTDNATNLCSAEAERYYDSKGIRHETSSPEFP